jgi:hypothetical protein
MKLLIIILTILLTSTTKVSADSIDHWRIYFNKSMVLENNEVSSEKPFILKLSELTETDSITVIYFSDSPCSDCTTYLQSDDGTKARLMMAKGVGTSTPLTFKIKDLLLYHTGNYRGSIKLLLFERRTEILRSRQVLEIKFD